MAQLRGSSCEDTQEMKIFRGDPRYLQGMNYRDYKGDTEMHIKIIDLKSVSKLAVRVYWQSIRII